MKILQDKIYLSASDLSTHIACPHATFLDLQNAKGLLKPPGKTFVGLRALQQRGEDFERNYLGQLKAEGKSIVEIDKNDKVNALQHTIHAMASGADIIYQARLEKDAWNGWADFLVKSRERSKFGDWSYQVMDTKLSRETRAGAILQICLYSEI